MPSGLATVGVIVKPVDVDAGDSMEPEQVSAATDGMAVTNSTLQSVVLLPLLIAWAVPELLSTLTVKYLAVQLVASTPVITMVANWNAAEPVLYVDVGVTVIPSASHAAVASTP